MFSIKDIPTIRESHLKQWLAVQSALLATERHSSMFTHIKYGIILSNVNIKIWFKQNFNYIINIIIIYFFMLIRQLFEVFTTINNQSLEKLNGIVSSATGICTIVYIAVGFFGYVAYCSETFSGKNFFFTFILIDKLKFLFNLVIRLIENIFLWIIYSIKTT